MKIAVIGAGYTGLAAAWDLRRAGHEVTILEATSHAGGLASGFSRPEWEWTLEHHYHHIFTSDLDIQNFITELGITEQFFFQTVLTKTRVHGKNTLLDSASSLLRFPFLSPIAKFRTAVTLAFFRYTRLWKIFEHFTAEHFLRRTMGNEAYAVLWEPLFMGKFGRFASSVNAAWFWARIHVRSARLGYFPGGFARLSDHICSILNNYGVKILLHTPVLRITANVTHLQIMVGPRPDLRAQSLNFDQILVCAPSHILTKIVPDLPTNYTNDIQQLQGIGAQTLILELDRPFFHDKTYWLNINEKDWPFLAVVEHTNLASSQHYSGKSIVYIGKYLEPSDPQFSLSKEQLLQKYHPYLQKLSPQYHRHLTDTWLYTEPFAQPIPPVNHSPHVPSFHTPLPSLYWASMQHVYPWDRGTNYAIAIGRSVAAMMITDMKKLPSA